MVRDRFDIDLLDPDDPFELDMGNLPHMHKHVANDRGRYIAIGPEDALDVFLFGDPLFYPGREDGEADWIMVGEVPGGRRVHSARATEIGQSEKVPSDRCLPGIRLAEEEVLR